MMTFRKLYAAWGFLDLCLLTAGALCIIFSVVFMNPKHPITSLIFAAIDFKLGIGIGTVYVVTCIFSVPAVLQPRDKPMLLKALNVWLIGAASVTLAVGTVIWITSLRQLDTFANIWARSSAQVQQAIQDEFSCCGYWNGTASGLFTNAVGFCADEVQAANTTGCQPSITSAKAPGTDFTLESMFSSIYGFEVIICLFFLATVCVVKEREVQVRFARIDEKRGGGGFV